MKKLLLLSLILSYGMHAMDKNELAQLQRNQEIDDIFDSGPYQIPTDMDNLIANISLRKVYIVLSDLVNILGPMGCVPMDLFSSDNDNKSD